MAGFWCHGTPSNSSLGPPRRLRNGRLLMSRNHIMTIDDRFRGVWGMAGFWCHGTLKLQPNLHLLLFEEWPAFDVTERNKNCLLRINKVWGMAGFWCHGTHPKLLYMSENLFEEWPAFDVTERISRIYIIERIGLRNGRLLMSRNVIITPPCLFFWFEEWPAFDVTERTLGGLL